MKVLLAYGTRSGATESTAEEIAKILRQDDFDVTVVNAKKEKIKDISGYELIIVGTGIQMGRWTGEIEDFVKRFEKQLPEKKLALFVSTGKMMSEREGKAEEVAKTRKIDIDDKVAKFQLQPIAIGFFGGVLNFNKMNFITKRAFGGFIKQQMGTDGFKETELGVYDMRDWDEIRSWAKELALKVR